MPRKTKTVARRTWTTADSRELKQLAKQGLSGAVIAKRMKRTPAAVYQRASVTGVQLTGNRPRASTRSRRK